MAVSTQVVRFQKSTGANGTTQDVTLNFTPKAIIVISAGEETDNTLLDQQQISVGFSDGTTQGVVSTGSQDNAAAGNAGRVHRDDSVFCRLSETVPTTTIVSRGSVIFAANKCTFTWDVNDAVATWITVWAFGGSDIQAKVLNSEIGRTTVGTTDYTGLGFTPQGNDHTAVFTVSGVWTAFNTINGYSDFSLGVATRTDRTKSGYIGIASENSDPSDTWRTCAIDRDYVAGDSVGGYIAYGYLNAWLSDGFQIYYDDVDASGSWKNTYLVIDGGNWDVGSFSTPTSITANVDYTVAVNSKPIKGMMLLTDGTGISGWTTYAAYSIGVTDGTNQGVNSSMDRDNQATTDSFRITAGNAIYAAYNSLGALTDRGNFDSFGTNSFRLDYTVKSTNVHAVVWVVVADGFTLFDRPVSETAVTVGTDTLTRLLMLPRPISETAITIDPGSVTRLRSIFRTISETSVTIGAGSVTRLQNIFRTITDPSITVGSGAVTGLQQLFRTISETSVTIGAGSVTGAKQVSKTISETAVTVGADVVNRIQLLLRSISDTSVTVGAGSVSLFQSLIRTISETAVTVGAGSVTAGKLLTVYVTEPVIKWYYSVFTKKVKA